MDLLEQPALVEDLEVAPDGHVRDAELAHEVGDPDRAVLADAIEDECLALAREHQRSLWCTGIGRDDHPRLTPSDREIAAQRTESQRTPTGSRAKPLRVLDMQVAGTDNPADPVGFCRAASEEEYHAMAEPIRVDPVSRRTVLKGIAGAAGLVSIPAIIACSACSLDRASAAPARSAAARRGWRQRRGGRT